jgi:hypothetical protein
MRSCRLTAGRAGRDGMGVVAVAVLALAAASLAWATRLPHVSGSFAVACTEAVGGTPSPRADGFRVVLGDVSVATENAAERVAPVDLGGATGWRYWEKSPVSVRAGKVGVTVTVPRAWRSRVELTWGTRGRVGSEAKFGGCADGPPASAWNIYAGGFYLTSRSACVPIVIRAGGRTSTVRFAFGKRCT